MSDDLDPVPPVDVSNPDEDNFGGFIIFVSRKDGIIIRYLPYHAVTDHGEFVKLQVTQEQLDLVHNFGLDEIVPEALVQDFPGEEDIAFLTEEYNADVRDLRHRGLEVAKYIRYNPPEEEDGNEEL